ncbi:NAD(P)-dependent dehydrogenase, short-chain alcohol dehydrogenase family [Amycolatopsis arida]|uniref:NAD(P)-dependent dehydrogenase, short-chain alcohol dehydrogenase family n=1 Tax=Amycolatopsis arida TaxID=587909 RepID=A0A1I6ATE2_9PSEU|nr:SDR family oxidoreductase [Amycolatopsis arida]TDX97535.1 NAD(P)-dependent dehydrogenase (short-subunit alcohol dehydrogenase family) [Amycolatopsis arida]SFQ71926.1 NAD(P)-dependent dehydrogenase, short-chain alcohol dehydrogenase family [Amycolatopsis arida]
MSGLFDLTGKVALVTGGTSGIGRMMACGLLEAGASVYVSARTAADGAAVVDELSRHGRVAFLRADLSTAGGCRGLAEAVAGREERLHVLVNNAGVHTQAPLAEFPVEDWDRVLDLNLRAPFLLTQALLPLLAAAATGDDPARVINVGSIAGLSLVDPSAYAYSASKAGLHHLTRVLAKELVPRRVTVNAVAPGPFESRQTAALLAEHRDVIAEAAPFGRIGRPDDMAGVAVFLAGRAGAYVTGAVIPVDGGISTTG